MSIASDIRTLWRLVRPGRGVTHADRLEAFYAPQSEDYDAFRRRLLPGRGEMFRAVADAALAPSDRRPVWLDLGGGTGANVEHLADRLDQIEAFYIVDLSPSLLKIARRRIADSGWRTVHAAHADATTFRPPDRFVDVVTFSYSLTMIPDWFAAVEHAWKLLRPGGVIGVVDFYVSRRHSPVGRAQHGWFTRSFWPAWFGVDEVMLSPDHLAMLQYKFDPRLVRERRTRIPYFPIGKVPYYLFVGVKPA